MSKTKVLFFLLIILTHAQCAFSAVEIKGKKWDLINKAKSERKAAMGNLQYAESIAWHIPDLGDQQHFKALIGSAIVTLATPQAKAKIVGAGLALIASIADKSYDRYIEMKENLISTNYHLEMAKFYDLISLEMSNVASGKNGMDTGEDQATKDYYRAVDSIVMASMLAQCIEDKVGVMTICNTLDEHLDCLKRRGNNMLSDSESLVEQIGEILADFCQDEELFNEIEHYVVLSHEYLTDAQTVWNKKKNAARKCLYRL